MPPPGHPSGPPSPEVTGAMCRVPSRGFSRAPERTQLTYLCRFAVRAVSTSRRAFLGSPRIRHAPKGSPSNWRADKEESVPRRSTAPTGHGISTVCPSSTPLGLDLGPTNLGRTNLAQEPLGFRRGGFSPPFSLLIPAFSLPPRPPVLPVWLHPAAVRSPTPAVETASHSIGGDLEPRTLSARVHSTSQLLRTV